MKKKKKAEKIWRIKSKGMFKIFMNFQLDHMPFNKWRVTSKLSLQLSDSDKWYSC